MAKIIQILTIFVLIFVTNSYSLEDLRTYHLVNEKKNWADAVEACKQIKGKLASITSWEENKAALRLIDTAGVAGQDVWIGGNDIYKEGHFLWESTGEAFDSYDFTDWGPNQPDNSFFSQDCVCFYQPSNSHGQYYSWDDQNCSDKKIFLCEV